MSHPRECNELQRLCRPIEYSDEDGLCRPHRRHQAIAAIPWRVCGRTAKRVSEAVTDYLETCAVLGREPQNPIREIRSFAFTISAACNRRCK